ncbi:MAG: hypothetical protein J6D21_08830 [Clostridia bacterium]|nr:hypothetical protein [Clostridia bacterium]
MKFTITKHRPHSAETLYSYLAIAMCVSVFLVYCITSFSGGAVPAGSMEDLCRNWIEETALYDLFGFDEAKEDQPPAESVYTRLPEGESVL